jgi:hypothetical protein
MQTYSLDTLPHLLHVATSLEYLLHESFPTELGVTGKAARSPFALLHCYLAPAVVNLHDSSNPLLVLPVVSEMYNTSITSTLM